MLPTRPLQRLSSVALLLVILSLLGWVVIDLSREPVYQSPLGNDDETIPEPRSMAPNLEHISEAIGIRLGWRFVVCDPRFLAVSWLLAPVPLLFALRGASLRQAFYSGLVAGGVNALIVAGFCTPASTSILGCC
ncbi:MAG: hypothetical protein R3C68_07575 [Myxococcota bacterium]